jgi:hypothetical protein
MRLALLFAPCLIGAAVGQVSRSELESLIDAEVADWRFHFGETDGAEQESFDDSPWEQVQVGHVWWPSDSTCWFRAVVTIPDRIHGLATEGATIRLKLAVDNEAKAYVNGAFTQEFSWADGDIVLTERATPGERIVVALHCVNRPGFGRLYQADLVSSRSEPMVNAIEKLLDLCEFAQGDQDFVPEDEAERWRQRTDSALQTLDMAAYHEADTLAFLASVDDATNALLADKQTFDESLARAGRGLVRLQDVLMSGTGLGWHEPYVRANLRVVESFIDYVRDDMNDGDVRHEVRALKIADYLNWLVEESEKRIEIATRESDGVAMLAHETGRSEIRDGAFWQNGRPIFYTGVGHFSQVREDIPILNDYGLNIIQIEMGPQNALPDPNTVDTQAIHDNVVRWLDAAAEHNIAVNLLVSPHYFPQWAIDQNPELANCGYEFIKNCIDAPESRAVYEKWLRALMPLVRDHAALHSICLSNEPHYRGQCAHSKEMFADWLAREYETVAQLNSVYGTTYTGWNDVPMPTHRENYALFFDWCRFNQDRLLEFHKFERDIIHEYDPDLPVHAKVMSYAFRDPGEFENGINFEGFNQLGTIAGNDCSQMYNHEPTGEYAQEWLQMAMNYTLQHCTAPDSPIFNSEAHIIVDGDWRYVPESHIRTYYWSQALHGQGAATTWVWERGQAGDFAENILTRPNCVRAMGHVALDLNRLAPEVYALQRTRSEAAILYSYSSLLPSQDYAIEAQKAFEGAFFTGAVFDFVTERQTIAGKLANYKLLVLPRASNAPDNVLQAIQDYIRSGGTVLAVGNCFDKDQHGRARDERLRQEGSGRLVSFPYALSARAYRELLDTLLDEASVPRRIRLEGEYGEPVWGVNLRTVEINGKTLVNLINFSRDDARIRLVRTHPISDATNLFTYQPLQFPLMLKPLEPVLLEIVEE